MHTKYTKQFFKIAQAIVFVLIWSLTSLSQAFTQSTVFNPWDDVQSKNKSQQRINSDIDQEQATFKALEFQIMKNFLKDVPKEFHQQNSTFKIELPYPEGNFHIFKIWESPIMDEMLGAKYPNIKTYIGESVSELGTKVRFVFSPKGLYAFIVGHNYEIVIEPAYHNNLLDHIIYPTSSNPNYTAPPICKLKSDYNSGSEDLQAKSSLPISVGTELREYRLGVAVRGDLSLNKGWATKADVMVGVTARMNEVNAIFERDVSIRFNLVAGTDKLFYLDTIGDPFWGNPDMLAINQQLMDDSIGTANYDIGHMLKGFSGGLAALPSVCSSSNKAKGFSSYDFLKTVCHEFGHQFNAPHSFNSETDGCGGNRTGSSAYEPGSGSTIMSYHGSCGINNIPNPGDVTYFNVGAFDQMATYAIGGGNCYTSTPTGNNPPTVTVPAGGFYIPVSTPFELTGSASDPDGDPLTYSWEQYNLGPAGDWNTPSGDAPIFRVFNPVTTGTRVFPQISDIVNNTTTVGELLPTYSRNLNFRLFVRDNQLSGGGANFDEIAFLVDDTAGPFVVTSPNTNTTFSEGSNVVVTWDVANTDNANVNCTSVNILLSTDGGFTYPISLLTGSANDGSESVVLPVGICGTQNRIRVEADGNIFFDISDSDFSIISEVSNISFANLTTTQVDISWDGGTATNFDLIWGTKGFDPLSTGTLVSNISTTSQQISSLSANVSYDVYVREAGGSSCWVGPLNFKTLLCDPVSIPYSDGFENGGSLSACWYQSTEDDLDWTVFTGSTPSLNTGPSAAYEGSYYAYLEASGTSQLDTAILIGPAFDLSSVDTAKISFYYHMYGSSIGTLELQIECPAGSGNWTNAWSITGEQGNQWYLAELNISSFIGKTIHARFLTFPGPSNPTFSDIAVDLFSLETCFPPSSLTVASSENAATVSLVSPTSPSHDIEYGLPGFNLGSGTQLIAQTGTSINISSLATGTEYEFYLRGNCLLENNNLSVWSGPYSFRTLSCSQSIPYNESFENGGSMASCWYQSTIDDQDWTVNTGSTGTGGTGPGSASDGSYYMYFEASGTSSADTAVLFGPGFDLTSVDTARVQFDYHMYGINSGIGDLEFQVECPAGSGNWSTAWSKSGDQGNQWNTEDLDLTGFVGKVIQIRFLCKPNNPPWSDFAIDNFSLNTCFEPNNITVLEDQTSVTISWNSNGSPAHDIEWGNEGFTQGSGTLVTSIVGTSHMLSGLTEGQVYEFYIRGNCTAANNNLSNWIGPFTFRPCTISAVPFVEDFETESGGDLPPCWIEDLPYDQNADGWETHTGPTPSGPTTSTGPDGAHEGSQYIYFESSGGPAVKSGALMTPIIDATGVFVPEVSFYYHMRGWSITSLEIQIRAPEESMSWTTLATILGQQHPNASDSYTQWSMQVISFAQKYIQLRFVANTTDSSGDIAIDYVTVSEAGSGCTTEICNGMDDDCDGMIDEDLDMIWYQDMDGDMFGNPSVTTMDCSQPAGYVDNMLDCDDTNNMIHPAMTENTSNGIDDDCDGQIDETANFSWVLQPNGANNRQSMTCTSTTDCCTQTFCYGLEFTPASTGTLLSYTTGFFVDCISGSDPVSSNVSCVMTDMSNVTDGCAMEGEVLINASGNSGSLSVTAGNTIIIHQICFSIPDNVSVTLTEDEVTDLSASIDVPGVGIVTEYPDFTPETIEGNTAPQVTAGSIDPCYPTELAAEAAAIAATTVMDDCDGAPMVTASTSGTCSATITVTATDECGTLMSSVMYNTTIDNTAPTGSAPTGSTGIDACYVDANTPPTGTPAFVAATVATNYSDNCGGAVTATLTNTAVTGNDCSWTVTYTYKVSDGCGNELTGEMIQHTGGDSSAPSLTVPGTITVDIGSSGSCDITNAALLAAIQTDGAYSVSDNCSTPTVTIDEAGPFTGQCSGSQPTVVVTVRATDGCTNSVTQNVTVTLSDTTAPSATAPTATELECSTDLPGPATDITGFLALTGSAASDNCTAQGSLSVSSSTGSLAGDECSGTITRTYTITDLCGNATMVDHVFNVSDNTDPVLAVPATITVDIGSSGSCDITNAALLAAIQTDGAYSVSDNCGTPTVTIDEAGPFTGQCSGSQPTVVVTVRATDGCTNSVTQNVTVTLSDTTAPSATAPTATELECSTDLPGPATDITGFLALTGSAASDNCTAQGSLSVSSSTGSLAGDECSGTITRTYTITDLCGNATMVDHVFNVSDNTDPVLAVPATITVDIGSSGSCDITNAALLAAIQTDGAYSVSDNCGTPTITIDESGPFTGQCSGSQPTVVVTVRATDGCTNSVTQNVTVTLSDTTAPSATAPTATELECSTDLPGPATDITGFLALTGSAASDNCTAQGSLSVSSSTGSLAGDECSGTITRTYTITDLCGNATMVDHVFNVSDNTNPTASNPAPINAQCSAPAPDITVVTDEADNCTASPVVTHVSDVSDGMTCPEVITRTYRVTDACGNFIDVTQTITLHDTMDPTFSGTMDATTIEGCVVGDAPSAVNSVSALEALDGNMDLDIMDNCTVDGSLTVSSIDSNSGTCPIVITRTYTITDACGNSVDVIHTININDTTDPVLTMGSIASCYATESAAESAAIAATGGSDNCGGTVSYSASTSGSCPSTITVTGMDPCGNTATVQYMTIITNGIAPSEVGGPVSTGSTVQSSQDATPPTTLPVIQDVCGNTLTPTGPVQGGTYMDGDCEGTITYTYTYTDCAGTNYEWVYTYTIECGQLNLKLYMEGPYSVSGDTLTTDLNTNHLLPGQDKMLSQNVSVQLAAPYTPFGQPYSAAPWSYTGNAGDMWGDPSAPGAPGGVMPYPSHVVDWIYVQVRENGMEPGDKVHECAGWLHSDGSVSFPEDCGSFTINPANDYFIVVQHRNHLGILAEATVLGTNPNYYLELDFTQQDSYTPDVFRVGQKEISPGVWVMYSSNGEQENSQQSINSADHGNWANDQNNLGYDEGDHNMNVTTNSEDETLWKNNQNKTSGVNFQ